MRRSIVGILVVAGLLLAGRFALAHGAICTCFLNKDSTPECYS